MNKKILAVDMDETLLNTDKTISEENIKAISELLDRGHILAIDTGRPIHGIKKLLAPYGVFNSNQVYYLGYQGVIGYNPTTGSKIFTDYVDSTIAASLMKRMHDAGFTSLAFDDTWIYTFEDNDTVAMYNKITEEPVKYIRNENELLNKEICKCMAIDFNNHENLETLKLDLQNDFSRDLNLMFSTPYFLESVKKEASKGRGLKLLADALGIDVKDTVACGDERNDISMISMAGLGVAVSNAQSDVLNAADYITKNDNNQGAVAEVIYKFFL